MCRQYPNRAYCNDRALRAVDWTFEVADTIARNAQAVLAAEFPEAEVVLFDMASMIGVRRSARPSVLAAALRQFNLEDARRHMAGDRAREPA